MKSIRSGWPGSETSMRHLDAPHMGRISFDTAHAAPGARIREASPNRRELPPPAEVRMYR